MDFGGTVLLAALGAFSLLFFVVGIVFYVLKSIGLSTLAANRGLDNPWLAWIPVADLYIMGMLVEEIDVLEYHIDNLGLWAPVIFVGGAIFSATPVLGWLVSIALTILRYSSYINSSVIYRCCDLYSIVNFCCCCRFHLRYHNSSQSESQVRDSRLRNTESGHGRAMAFFAGQIVSMDITKLSYLWVMPASVIVPLLLI